MARVQLSDEMVLELSADPGRLGEKLPAYLWDAGQKNFGARLFLDGRVSFVFKQVVGKRPIWETLGDFPAMSLVEARKRARQLKETIEAGRKPKPDKLIPIRWTAMVEKFEKAHFQGLKVKTAKNYQSVCNVHIIGAFGKKFVHEITDEDIRSFYFSKSHITRQANVILGLIRKIFEYAEGWKHRELMSNPVVLLEKQNMKTFPENSRDRPITEAEMVRLAQALRQMEEEGWHQFASIFKIAYLMGGRITEVLSMRWDCIDTEAKNISWIETKTGPIQKVLTEALFEVIETIPRFEGSPFVFPSLAGSDTGHVVDIKRPWRRLLLLSKVEGLTRHDLRHNFGEEAADLDYCLQSVAALLGQKHASSAERYSKTRTKTTARNANAVSNRLRKKL